MKKKKSFWLNPWTIGVGSTVLASIVLQVIDKIFGTETLNFIFDIISAPFIWIYSILVIKISTMLFVFILVFVAGIVITFAFLYFTSKDNSKEEVFTPPFLKYTEDMFKNLFYRWQWLRGYDGKFRVRNIIALCPDCKCNLVYEKCPNCGRSFNYQILSEPEVEALVHHHLEQNNM